MFDELRCPRCLHRWYQRAKKNWNRPDKCPGCGYKGPFFNVFWNDVTKYDIVPYKTRRKKVKSITIEVTFSSSKKKIQNPKPVYVSRKNFERVIDKIPEEVRKIVAIELSKPIKDVRINSSIPKDSLKNITDALSKKYRISLHLDEYWFENVRQLCSYIENSISSRFEKPNTR